MTGRAPILPGVERENVCRKCGVTFIARTHRALDCVPCRRAAQRDASRTHRQNYPEKTAARALFGKQLQRGKIERPKRCSHCGVACKPHGHHPDYTKPLEVVWLCRRCHFSEHVALESFVRKAAGPKPERVDRKRAAWKRRDHLRFVIVSDGRPS